MLNEIDIKKALFENLSSKEEECVIANEMVSERGCRRADMVLITDILYAFEIKGANDSLKRLKGQVESYQSNFNKTILVVTDKHVEEVLNFPNDIGVWLAYRKNTGGVRFKVLRKGKKRLKVSKEVLCDFMHKSEIFSLLSESHTPSFLSTLSRNELIEIAIKLPFKILASKAIACLKKRYYWTHQNFLDYVDAQKKPSKEKRESRSKLINSHSQKVFECMPSIRGAAVVQKRKIDFSRLLPEGDDLNDIPQHVFIPRRSL